MFELAPIERAKTSSSVNVRAPQWLLAKWLQRKLKEVIMRRLFGWLVAGALVLGAGTTWAQQQDKSVKSDVKQAGNATARAAKNTGRTVKKQTKKVVHAGAKGTRQGAQKVERSTEKK